MKDFDEWFEELTEIYLENHLPAPSPLAYTYEYDHGLTAEETFLADNPEFNYGD